MDVLWNKKSKWFHLVCITNISLWGITYKDMIYEVMDKPLVICFNLVVLEYWSATIFFNGMKINYRIFGKVYRS